MTDTVFFADLPLSLVAAVVFSPPGSRHGCEFPHRCCSRSRAPCSAGTLFGGHPVRRTPHHHPLMGVPMTARNLAAWLRYSPFA